MTSSGMQSAPAELFRALAVLAEPPVEGHARVAEALGLTSAPDGATYAELFLFQLHPYASVYLGAEGMLGGDARDRVAGFWRAVGRTPPAESDHLSALLGLYASLLDEAADAAPPQATLIRRSAAALLHEHLAPWMPLFLEGVRGVARGLYRDWADLLEAALRGELRASPAAGALPLHLRVAPELPDPRAHGADAFLSGLLAPVRSGILVTRADVAELGRSLGIGVKMGSRRSVLEHLLAEAPEAVLGALGAAAEARARGHGAWSSLLPGVAGFWSRRAEATARLLQELAVHGGSVEAVDGVEVTRR
ncbi:MAG TPA: molecular chaperone TorD family protein [Longimicrobiales bacterium]|nr:molecular chaperone TorD family protein [Longimicrobiales bacterium]